VGAQGRVAGLQRREFIPSWPVRVRQVDFFNQIGALDVPTEGRVFSRASRCSICPSRNRLGAVQQIGYIFQTFN